jgi:hypothetical protein
MWCVFNGFWALWNKFENHPHQVPGPHDELILWILTEVTKVIWTPHRGSCILSASPPPVSSCSPAPFLDRLSMSRTGG